MSLMRLKCYGATHPYRYFYRNLLQKRYSWLISLKYLIFKILPVSDLLIHEIYVPGVLIRKNAADRRL